MKHLICIALVTLPFVNSVQAEVEVRGARSCGSWIESRKEDGWPSRTAQAWLVGFLSGMALESDKDVLLGTDNLSIFAWMDKHCNENPLSSLTSGGMALFPELARQKGR